MHKCGEQRPQKEQAEVKQSGPYSCIVLAVLEVERKEKLPGRFHFPESLAGVSRGISRGTCRQ